MVYKGKLSMECQTKVLSGISRVRAKQIGVRR